MAETCVYSAGEITVLQGLEPVRRRPGMYIGGVHDGSGLHHLLCSARDGGIVQCLFDS